jgi:hypothetical protein
MKQILLKFSKFKNKFPGDEARFLNQKLILKNFLEMKPGF